MKLRLREKCRLVGSAPPYIILYEYGLVQANEYQNIPQHVTCSVQRGQDQAESEGEDCSLEACSQAQKDADL